MSTLPLPPVSPSPAASTFAYDAQTDDGHRVVGTIEATDAEHATSRLRAMQLRVLEVRPSAPRPDGKRMRGGDFITFNQQLAQLTAAGMPIEQGLRMIAADLGRGKLKRTVDLLATELEAGTSIDQAFDKYQNKFPPLYGRLIRAGVKGGNLPAVLLSLGKHLDLTQRLRATLWRAVSYPLVVLVAFGFLLSFLGMVVSPEFAKIYGDFRLQLPLPTRMLIGLSTIAPALLFTLIALVILAPIAWGMLQAAGYGNSVVERLVLPLPLIGPVLRANFVARWCDGTKLGVEAGLDLPQAIALGNDASGSQRLARDGAALAEALGAGRSLTSATTSLLPATVPAAIQFASGYSDLAGTLDSLSDMYRRQAETRLEAVPGVLTPLLVLLIAFMIGFVIVALFAPLASLLKGIQGW
jgi:type IV pilus assembly protein PilC